METKANKTDVYADGSQENRNHNKDKQNNKNRKGSQPDQQ